MRVCDCVTQSSLNDIDEEVAHLSGSRERTGRRKNMTKKMKVRVSALVMCAAILVSAMSVLAADVSHVDTIALDNSARGTAVAGIQNMDTYAYASTSGTSIYNDILVTRINGYGYMPDEGTGQYSASAEGSFESATSYHKWTSRTHTISVYA